MDCLMSGTVRCCTDKLGKAEREVMCCLSRNVSYVKSPIGATRLAFVHHAPAAVLERRFFSRSKYLKGQLLWTERPSWGALVPSSSLDTELSPNGGPLSVQAESSSEEAYEEQESRQLTAKELKALLMDSERRRLVKKLSEANQHNRFLKRQLQLKDEDLINIKSDLAMLELDLEALVGLAEEVANSGVQPGTRKINGRYIQSHLLSKLEAVRDKLKKQAEGVDLIKFQEVTLFWVGMAESVQVMGSFDGWSQGEEMSPEYDGSCARFSTTLKLRPGRYEIKFLVDGQWQLSSELPTIGEGLTENNLLVV